MFMIRWSFVSSVDFAAMFAIQIAPVDLKMQLSLSLINENFPTLLADKSITRIDEEILYSDINDTLLPCLFLLDLL